MSSGILDSLPTNGTINSLLRMWKQPYQKAYFPIFVCSCIVPAIGTLVAYILVMMGFH